MAEFARVIPDGGTGRPLDYAVPLRFRDRIGPGSRVRIPLRSREVLGTVIALLNTSEVRGVRELEAVLADQPELPPSLLRLADWIASYYCCPPEVAFRCVLPQAVRSAEIKPRFQKRVRIDRLPHAEDFDRLKRRAPRQAALLEFLISADKPMPSREVLKRAGCAPSVLAALEKEGYVVVEKVEWERDPHAGQEFLPTSEQELNDEQAAAFQLILDTMEGRSPMRPILLHGVTGSGKTEIYLQAIRRALDSGRTALVLVPEIALTPQTIERFKSRFSEIQKDLAVLHSKLSDGERYDEWRKIRSGRARIVIGARSAVFAPVEKLGLIVVDEEHESSYKQEDAPRYQARDLAVVRGHLERCPVVLGSATPSLESAHNVRIGKYGLARLTKRVDDRKMPVMRILDMRQMNRKRGSDAILSLPLGAAIQDRLNKAEQVILFLNRRGYASSMICASCGHVCRCDHCSVALTYHRSDERIVCHICGHSARAPRRCPHCSDPGIRHAGIGTERVEETVRRMFPKARIARMDADSMTRKHAMRETLEAFRARKIDILIGTQMIAKGLDFPNVTLVGIINADLSLHLPDFRAGERTFQLLTQVAGRAGRGDLEGEVIVQSFTPFSPAIQFARHHDFDGFKDQEFEFREKFGYPPFSHMILLTVKSPALEKAEFSATTLARRLREKVSADVVLGDPAPAPLERSHGFHRFHVTLRGQAIRSMSGIVRVVLDDLTFPEDVSVSVDVDPYQLL